MGHIVGLYLNEYVVRIAQKGKQGERCKITISRRYPQSSPLIETREPSVLYEEERAFRGIEESKKHVEALAGSYIHHPLGLNDLQQPGKVEWGAWMEDL